MSFTTPPPRVSVVICTRNRCGDLVNALRSAVEQQENAPPYEVVVVDNASTDATAHAVNRFATNGTVRYVHEPTLGLCHARNTGWRTARGEYIAYLDDDATASPTWVAAVVEGFARSPQIAAVGGRVDPVWQAPRPAWLDNDVAVGLTIVNWSDAPTVLTDLETQWLVGANMAIRADVLRTVGGFRSELDRVGTKMLSSGDVFMLREVVRLGYDCLYYPAMAVTHLVPPSRLTKTWFRNRYYWQGVSNAVMELLEHRPSVARRAWLGARSAVRLARDPIGLARLMEQTDDPARFKQQCWKLVEMGHLVGLWTAAWLSDGDESSR